MIIYLYIRGAKLDFFEFEKYNGISIGISNNNTNSQTERWQFH